MAESSYSLVETPEELEEMTIEEISAEEKTCMESNAWRVAQEVCERVHVEPGPAGDLMIGIVDDMSDIFFYNTK